MFLLPSSQFMFYLFVFNGTIAVFILAKKILNCRTEPNEIQNIDLKS